jgi:hypothetical protein
MDWYQALARSAVDIASYWFGWQILDWLRPVALGAVVASAGWFITRWRQWPWQRELRGAAVALIALLMAMALLPRPKSDSASPRSLSASAKDTTLPDDKAGACVSAPAPTPLPMWFDNDGLQWRMAKELRTQIQARLHEPNADSCLALVIHYPTPYSQHIANELNTLLAFSGCETSDILADRTLDDGLEVRTARTGSNPAYAEFLRSVLNEKAGVNVRYNLRIRRGRAFLR